MSNLSDTIGKYIPLASRKPKIGKKEALAIIPVRNSDIAWERRGDEVVLSIPMRNDGLARVIRRLVKNLPETRQLGLDDVGSCVWEMCDGERNINNLVGSVSKSYKLTRREAEASVTMFLQTLAKRNLIGLMSAGGNKGVKRKP